ncbi:ribosome 60S biogenesis N-terminal-domain-containing protein [Cubamyces lactineus]|nr:ribosome 60S biogenesis N-terminal-domain-containing protein [Cubamyces lactineus]
MPVRDQPAQKKRKVEASSKQTYKYGSAKDIQRALKAQSEAGLIEGLNALRNQFTIKSNEAPIAVNDERLVLAKEWLETDPGAQELFSIWESTNARQMSLLAAIVGVLATLLTLLSSHYTYHAHAQPILRALLSQQWAHHLNLYLSGQHTELILVTLKLYNSMSNFAGGRERKAVLDVFAWETKALPKLLQMRRRTKGGDDVDPLQKPDIRTLYILFVLSFLDTTTGSSVKATFLEQHRDAFAIIFKGLWQDSYSVIRRVLEICWSGLWSDAKLKRALKIQVFNEVTLSQLLRIYERNVKEGPDPESVPADVVHHFLLALCSHPGVGLCFHDRGWYPRETDADQKVFADAEDRGDETAQKGGRIYNKILANVIKTLKVNEDPRQQELALKILAACPELVAGYWSSAGFALEPRLSSKWLANIAFFGAVVSLPVPTSSFFLPESGSSSASLYQPTPPPLSTIIDNILPTAHIKIHLSRGLQAPSPLVQHVTALTLAKCLSKYEQVVRAFQEVERALEEDEEEGLWARRRREIEREVRKRVPDFQVIVGFSQRLNEATTSSDAQGSEKQEKVQGGKDKQKERAPNPTRTALLTESAHRLLWLYHRLLPSVVAEARFDAGKLLQAIEDMLLQTSVGSPTAGLDTLRQLHVLRLLRESEHFTWSGKSGSKHSNFYILLKAYVITPVAAVRTAIVALLRHILSAGVLFQHDADEISLWLESLPLTRRASNARAPDGAATTDEGDGVIAFLDDCVQRCVKTPYKYVEELQALYTSASTDCEHASSIGERPEAYPSPLLATVLEQLSAKMKGKLLSPSDSLSLFAFTRKLLLRIASKSIDLGLLSACVEKIGALVEGQELFPEYSTIGTAIRREVSLLRDQIEQLRDPREPMELDTTPAVQEFLTRAEALGEPSSGSERQTSAYELVDWIRLTGPRLHPSELDHFMKITGRLYTPALKELLYDVNPRETSLRSCASTPNESLQIADFTLLFLHTTHDSIEDQEWRAVLVKSLLTSDSSAAAVRRAIRLILHRLTPSTLPEAAVGSYLSLLSEVIEGLRSCSKVSDAAGLVLFTLDSDVIKSLCSRLLNSKAREGLDAFLTTCAGSGNEEVIQVLSSFTSKWALALRESLDAAEEDKTNTALLWFKYATAGEAFSLLDYLADRAEHSSSARALGLIERVLEVTAATVTREQDALTQALPLLSRLHSLLPSSSQLQSLIASGTAGSLPLCYDGQPPARSFSEWNVASLAPLAEKGWGLRMERLPKLSAESFLSAEPWTDATVDIVVTLLYRRPSVRPTVAQWLESPASQNCSTVHLVKVMSALYDSAVEGGSYPVSEGDIFESQFLRLVKIVKEARHPQAVCSMAASCVASIVAVAPSARPKLLKLLVKELPSIAPEKLSVYSLAVAVKLTETIGAEALPLAEQVADLGLKWAVRHFVDNDATTADSHTLLVYLARLVQAPTPVKSHLAEPVIAAVVQDRLASIDGTTFVRLLAKSTNLKPVTVNKYLQTIVQHARFYELCAPSAPSADEASPSVRDSIIDLLHTLFHLHPNNTCQPSHIEPLRRVYGGSLGTADLKILSIFQLFESTRRTPVTSLLSQWSGSADVTSNSALEALLALEPSRVLKTCLDFPEWRTLATDIHGSALSGERLYDPVFVLLLFTQMLAGSAPSSALVWVQLFRTNVVSLLLRTLSAKDAQLRDVAWAQTAALYRALEHADLQEKPHVMHILNLLKDLTTSAPTEEAPRLPAYTTLLLAHAFRGIFYPSNFIYPLTARFLLQRPTLDAADVPMLYGMLYSSSDDWKKERAWIVRFLSDGIVGNDEWRILKRRHTWDLLASLFQSEERDRTLRRGVLEVLANVTCNARATTSLILRHALLSWVEMQVQSVRPEEAIAWSRILENILAVVNPIKVEAATGGEWRAIVGRCVRKMMYHSACSSGVFTTLVPVMLRLSVLPGEPTPHLAELLARGVRGLQELEAEIAIPASGQLTLPLDVDQDEAVPVRLHRSQHLFDPAPTLSIDLWGECVESLWRVSMTLPAKTREWDALSSRLLLWRSIAGAERSAAGEWARREVLENLRTFDA